VWKLRQSTWTVWLTGWFGPEADNLTNQNGTKCEDCGIRSSVAEDSMLLEYDTGEILIWVPTVRGDIVTWARNVILLGHF